MIIKNAEIYGVDGVFRTGDLVIDGPMIGENSTDDLMISAEGLYAIPGLTDIHLHGAVGYDFCDGTPEAVHAIAGYLGKNGVTSFTPASMTYSEEILSGIFKNAKDFTSAEDEAMLMGINMEGPYIADAKRGAQNPAYIMPADAGMFRRLNELSGGKIRLVTLAPETEGAMDFIDAVKDEVVISIGHTEADYDIASEAFERGARHVTHLFNAMPPFSHRAPGVVGAAADHEEVCVEMICDGIHLHPSVIRTAFKMYGPERICLISDTMMAVGLEDGDYSLGGQDVTVKGKLATLADGTIAGSATNLMDCMKTAISFGISLEDAVQAAAVTPAKVIGAFDRIGSLETGKLANIVLLDRDLELQYVFIQGKKVFDRKEQRS